MIPATPTRRQRNCPDARLWPLGRNRTGLPRTDPSASGSLHRLSTALGTLLMDVGRWSDAVDVLAAAKARNYLSPIIRYRLTVSLWSAGRISEAEAEIDDALKQWPQHSAIWQTKVKLLALTGRPRMALTLASDPGGRPIEEKGELDRNAKLFPDRTGNGRACRMWRGPWMRCWRMSVAGRENGLTVALYCAVLGYSGLALDMIEGVYPGHRKPVGAPAEGSWERPCKPIRSSNRMREACGRTRDSRRCLIDIGLGRYWADIRKIRPDYRRNQ